MEIALFNDVTTEDILQAIEADGKKYEGLYVDMYNAPERKYVKENAAKITDIIKKLDRARIDKSKAYKAQVEKEFADIKERLEIANEPFTLLLDEYKEQRAKELAAKKAIEDARLLKLQIEGDHEMALLINKTYEYDKAQELKAKQEHKERIAKEAADRAIEQERINQENIKQAEINAENARIANFEHVRTVNRSALNDLVELGLTESNAMIVVKAIAKKLISNVTINY